MLHRGWLLLVILSLPPMIGYIWRGLTFGDWGWGLAGLVICAGFTFALWRGFLARVIDSNHGVYHRREQPLRYWLSLAILFGVYCLAVGAFFFKHHPR